MINFFFIFILIFFSIFSLYFKKKYDKEEGEVAGKNTYCFVEIHFNWSIKFVRHCLVVPIPILFTWKKPRSIFQYIEYMQVESLRSILTQNVETKIYKCMYVQHSRKLIEENLSTHNLNAIISAQRETQFLSARLQGAIMEFSTKTKIKIYQDEGEKSIIVKELINIHLKKLKLQPP